jgi:hypothetical protein
VTGGDWCCVVLCGVVVLCGLQKERKKKKKKKIMTHRDPRSMREKIRLLSDSSIELNCPLRTNDADGWTYD